MIILSTHAHHMKKKMCNDRKVLIATIVFRSDTMKSAIEIYRTSSKCESSSTSVEEIELMAHQAKMMHAALAHLPDDLTAAYKEACRWAPELIEKESNPSWFIR
jgi:hypothetical protein